MKGFTLIELLAVLIILGIVTMITVPMISNQINSAKDKAYDEQINRIEEISRNWGVSNTELLPDEGETYFLTLDKLKEAGLLDEKELRNPKDSSIMIGCIVIKFDNDTNQYSYKYNEKNCNMYIEKINDKQISYPILDDGMIAIKYENDKAYVANISDEWYSYKNSKWANAIVVKEDKKKDYVVGKEVVEDDVLAYFVWIPRYEYTVKSSYGVNGEDISNPGYIDIRFSKINEKSTGDANYTGDVLENWRTQDGFTLGDEELPGIWVGKFQTGYGTNISGYPNNIVIENPTIKPNVTSLRYQNVSIQYEQAKVFNNYGIKNESRLMKSDEWNTVAILSQSLYGRCQNDGSCPEVRRNNNSSYITGYSEVNRRSKDYGTDSSITQPYNTSVGKEASTTGNITGVYDMNGCAYEFVMGVLSDEKGNARSGYSAITYTSEQAKTILGRTDNIAVGIWNSGFNGKVYGKSLDGKELYVTDGKNFPDSKYYNLYTTNNINTGCNGEKCYGLIETWGWYNELAVMPWEQASWMIRGGHFNRGISSGIWHINVNPGRENNYTSFRVVITPSYT